MMCLYLTSGFYKRLILHVWVTFMMHLTASIISDDHFHNENVDHWA